jgi:hypothetical protein
MRKTNKEWLRATKPLEKKETRESEKSEKHDVPEQACC